MRDGGFEFKGKFHSQEFYRRVEGLDVSSYANTNEAKDIFKKTCAVEKFTRKQI